MVSTALGRPVDPDVSFKSAAPRYDDRGDASSGSTESSRSSAGARAVAHPRRHHHGRRVEPLGELENLGNRRPDVDRKDRRHQVVQHASRRGIVPARLPLADSTRAPDSDAEGREQISVLPAAEVEVGCRNRPIRGRQVDEGPLRIAAAEAGEPIDDGLHEPKSIL